MRGAHIGHSGAKPSPASKGLAGPAVHGLRKVEPTALQTAGMCGMNCGYAAGGLTSPRIRQNFGS